MDLSDDEKTIPAPVEKDKGKKKKGQPSTKKDEERPPPAADKGEKDKDKHPMEPPSITGADREDSDSPQGNGTSKKVTKDVLKKSAGKKFDPYHGKLTLNLPHRPASPLHGFYQIAHHRPRTWCVTRHYQIENSNNIPDLSSIEKSLFTS